MNQRIKDLILDAGFPKFDKMYVVSDGKELEKFAELIVRECAELANEETSLPYDSYSEKIKKHFGFK